MAQTPEHLAGRWVHSHEEDHDGIAVYRRPDYPFPPARGRRGVEFGPDGEFVERAIGRADGTEARPGRWDATPDGDVRARTEATGTTRRVVRVTPDVLEMAVADPAPGAGPGGAAP